MLNAVAVVAGLTGGLATLLVLANRWLHVPEDPRVAAVHTMLPHTNCGACGYPGCLAFAEAVVSGDASPARCSVATETQRARIAAFLGVDVGTCEKRVARLACAGGTNVSRHRAHYRGLTSCAAAATVAGGGKACFWGCLGLADCERACTFDAIEMNSHHLPVVDEQRCTACGDCVQACPKDLFSLQPLSNRLWVACSSQAHGDEVLEACEVGCTGCGRCALDAPQQIEMRNHLPIVHYDQKPVTLEPIQRCPTGAIVWLDPERGIVKGDSARPILRHGEIHDAPT